MLRVGISVESFRCADIVLLQWQGEYFAHWKHLKLRHFQPAACASKNPLSPKVFNRFSKSLPQLEDVEVGIWVQSYWWAGILLLQWQGEIVAHRQHLKFCDFQPVHCASKNPISPQVFNQFSKCLAQLEDFDGGHLGRTFQAGRYFTFAMARWKLCACTTFEISHFQSLHCYSKNPISPKVFNRFSKSLAQLEDVEGGHLCGKIQARRYFTFAMARWKPCACTTFEITHFQSVHCYNKNPISPKVFNRFSKSLAQLEDVEGGHLCGKIQARRYFTFAMARWKPCACTTFEITHFQSVHCYNKNPISPEVFNRFSKSWPQLDDVEGGHLGVKIEARSYFTFAMARWKVCPSTTFEISHFQPVHCACKNPIPPKVFHRFSKSWPQLGDFEGGHLGGKFEARRYFTFAMARWKLCVSTTFEIYYFQPVNCVSKNPISPNVFNRISKSLPQLEDVEGGHLGGKIQGRSYFTFTMARWRLCACTTFEISHFQSVHCHGKNPISPKVFNPFSKSLPPLENVERGHLGEKFQARRYFTFAMARWKLCASTTFEISHFQPVHCACKNPISPKVFNRFSKSLPQLDDVEGGHLGVKIEARSYFTFAMESENFAHRQHLKFCHFQPVHCACKNPISPKVFHRFSKSLPQQGDLEGGHSDGKF